MAGDRDESVDPDPMLHVASHVKITPKGTKIHCTLIKKEYDVILITLYTAITPKESYSRVVVAYYG